MPTGAQSAPTMRHVHLGKLRRRHHNDDSCTRLGTISLTWKNSSPSKERFTDYLLRHSHFSIDIDEGRSKCNFFHGHDLCDRWISAGAEWCSPPLGYQGGVECNRQHYFGNRDIGGGVHNPGAKSYKMLFAERCLADWACTGECRL